MRGFPIRRIVGALGLALLLAVLLSSFGCAPKSSAAFGLDSQTLKITDYVTAPEPRPAIVVTDAVHQPPDIADIVRPHLVNLPVKPEMPEKPADSGPPPNLIAMAPRMICENGVCRPARAGELVIGDDPQPVSTTICQDGSCGPRGRESCSSGACGAGPLRSAAVRVFNWQPFGGRFRLRR